MVPIIPICKTPFLAGIASILALPALAAPSDLSAFARARAADGDGAIEVAAANYASALNAAPGNAIVAEHAYCQAVEAGNYALADRAAATLAAAGQAPADAALLAIAKAAAAHDITAADTAITGLAKTPLALLITPLRAWAAFEHGADPLALLAIKPKDIVARRFAEETRGLILIAQGKTAQGIAALQPVLGKGQAAEDIRIAAAQLLNGAGRVDQAKTLLVGDARAIAALRDDPGTGVKPSLAFGASRLLARIASDIAAAPPGPLAIALTRAALRADPQHDRARLLLASSLAQSGLADPALTVLTAVDPDGPYAAAAIAARIEVLTGDDRLPEALKLAAAQTRTAADLQQYADLLMTANRPMDAAAVYAKLLARPDHVANWAAWLQYGGALDTAGDWERARPALARAVVLAPEEPVALNYFGYARLQHDEDVVAARAMLEKASRLAPTDPAITDSLGWAYHRAGENDRAVPLLERAAAAAPGNPEIAEHLGDAYWSTGRRYEARYAWRAAKLTADSAESARLSAKIVTGLATAAQ
ncbi:tetratricopeptide repeat protein [Sphingomonas sp. SUN019]|uniref:tetratricopeptide repeat protein n=1 Tax=Sphingomonas sp. SUN019 TaxID=2937788 RepID=UPI002164DD76|nr:tetratricopeptide repeat protein [Sphingomonas sp. SUN019]UVO49423.1 tetratricopeptide repeat protein [Sphingomonas sp. SUN019]